MVVFLILIESFILCYSLNKLKNKDLVYIFPAFFTFIHIYTYIGTKYFDFAEEIPFYYQIYNDYSFLQSGVLICSAVCFFIVGILFSKRYPIKWNNVNLEFKIPYCISIIIILFSIFISFLAFDFNELLYRQKYVTNETHRVLVILFKVLSPISSFLCGFIRNKYLKYNFLFLILSVPFSLNSRIISLDLMMFYIGSVLCFKRGFLYKSIIIFSVIFFSISPLILRGMSEQGFIYNILNLSYIFDISLDVFFRGVNYVTSFSVYEMEYALEQKLSGTDAFLISINPLPSSYLNVQPLYDQAMVNAFSPVPGIVMVYREGIGYHILFYFLCGFLFHWMLKASENHPVYIIFVSFFCGFVFMNSQYILRESVRLLYYCLIISLFMFFWNRTIKRIK
ncbi:putative membrane protein [Glaesserella parasuis 174]|uniref:Oligosaccharide repeat unit polymerase n=3 Tax=Glaesserella parasuis TaxID=738 RepID=T1RPW0_GLAPU|nr:hypothetical protein [Glaesserella parasuis]AGM38732.1 hypothetical protein [Glaesserella parasuis]EQA15388.1 putative membrane protein [Glaesserella parasuis 174]MDP0405272.1 hypothetical protein [Glaesserella parasuis]QIE72506.1 hypothetical protein G5C59_04715 [Glaesserella parasuis]